MTVTPESNPYPVGPNGPIYLTVEEVADRFRTSPSSVHEWRANGDGPLGVKFGRRVLFPLPAVEEWEQQRLEAARREQERRANPQPLAHLPRRMSS